MADKRKPRDREYLFSSDDSSESDADADAEAEADAGAKAGYDADSDDYSVDENQSDGGSDYYDDDDESPEITAKMFNAAMDSEWYKKGLEREWKGYIPHEEKFNFPPDPENWREEDLKELWADGPIGMTKPGWDPNWVDEEDVEVWKDEIEEGNEPPIAPFYLPYRKPYPVIPDNHHDISNPKSVIEELDRIEEFLTWVSYIFQDGSSYEGTVWDDLAHGKGVYVAEQGLVRYEGEWLQNNMEGHGVVEVEIPDIEPMPGSKLEEEMRAEGKIIKRDFMSPEDREWLEMDIEDSVRLAGGRAEIPFYENDEWIRQFGTKPEKGRYRYAGQWKHGRMHGCGVYEVNERTIFGRFYFGELLEDSYGCDADVSALHSGIAEVAAAKARMFINKPDGMVREERGPYSDPQHPYLYEEEDVWMAPGFINQFYEVPDYWKTYVHEVDEEREMWLNSFHRAPLRLPMPPELEYWWSNVEATPEFVLINKEPEPDPEDPSKLIYTEDPLILHTPTGRLINYVDDEEYGLRLFWQPPLKDGEDVDPDKAQFLPLGFDEFYGRVDDSDNNIWVRVIKAIENALKPMLEKVEKWTEEKKKEGEMKIELIEKELELKEAELTLKEVVEDMDEELKRMQEEEEKKTEMGLQEEEGKEQAIELERTADQEEEDEEEDEEDEDAPSSFGSAIEQDSTNKDKEIKNGRSPFAAASLSSAPSSLISALPYQLQRSFSSWKGLKLQFQNPPLASRQPHTPPLDVYPKSAGSQVSPPCSVSFPRTLHESWRIRAVKQTLRQGKPITRSRMRKHSKHKSQSCNWLCAGLANDVNILSLHTPV